MVPAPSASVSSTSRAERRSAWSESVPGLCALLLVLSCEPAGAVFELTAPDGRRVRLNDDQTWEYVAPDAGVPASLSVLEVMNRKEVWGSCRFGIRLTNRFDYEIDSLVPQFSSLTADGVVMETVFRGFSSIKPTNQQYQEIEFNGVSCDSIAHIQVTGGDRCSMGELTKFSPKNGECLGRIQVQPSDIVSISK